jgi:hypothetical protein
MQSSRNRRYHKKVRPLPQYLKRRLELLEDSDAPIYGAADIAIVLNLFNDEGEPDARAAYHAAAAGHVNVSKLGRAWTSTPRRLLAPHLTAA